MSDCNPMDYIAHGILQARILDWVAFCFSRGSSQPRDWNQVSLIAGGFFTSWATGETQKSMVRDSKLRVQRQTHTFVADFQQGCQYHSMGKKSLFNKQCWDNWLFIWNCYIFYSLSCQTLCNSSSVSRQEYWSALLCPPPGNLPNPGIETRSPALKADSLPPEPPGKPYSYALELNWTLIL